MMISPSLSKPWKMGKGCSWQQEQQGQRLRVRASSAPSSREGSGSRRAGRSGRTGEKVGLHGKSTVQITRAGFLIIVRAEKMD